MAAKSKQQQGQREGETQSADIDDCILAPFTAMNREAEAFTVTCERHRHVCWRLLITSLAGEYAGDLLFEPEDEQTMKLIEFHIFREFAGRGLGTNIMRA
jgi:hypothetical protein